MPDASPAADQITHLATRYKRGKGCAKKAAAIRQELEPVWATLTNHEAVKILIELGIQEETSPSQHGWPLATTLELMLTSQFFGGDEAGLARFTEIVQAACQQRLGLPGNRQMSDTLLYSLYIGGAIRQRQRPPLPRLQTGIGQMKELLTRHRFTSMVEGTLRRLLAQHVSEVDILTIGL